MSIYVHTWSISRYTLTINDEDKGDEQWGGWLRFRWENERGNRTDALKEQIKVILMLFVKFEP